MIKIRIIINIAIALLISSQSIGQCSCPCNFDIIIEMAQSNGIASGSNTSQFVPFGNNALIHNNYYDDGATTGLVPMNWGVNTGGRGATTIINNKFSMGAIVAWRNSLTRKTILFKVARGSSSLCDRNDIADWSATSGEIRDFAKEQFTSLISGIQDMGCTYEVVKVIWTQGESDSGTACRDDYTANFIQWKNDWNNFVGIPNLEWIVTSTSAVQTNPNYALIKPIQAALPATYFDMDLIPNIGTTDGTHFNTNTILQGGTMMFNLHF